MRKQTHELEGMLPVRRKKLQAEKTHSLHAMKDTSEGERSTELIFLKFIVVKKFKNNLFLDLLAN